MVALTKSSALAGKMEDILGQFSGGSSYFPPFDLRATPLAAHQRDQHGNCMFVGI